VECGVERGRTLFGVRPFHFLGVCFLGGSAAPSFASASRTDPKKWRLRMALPNIKERLSLTADLLDKRQLETAAP